MPECPSFPLFIDYSESWVADFQVELSNKWSLLAYKGAPQNLLVICESIQPPKISDFTTEDITGPVPVAFRKNSVLSEDSVLSEEFSQGQKREHWK